MKKQSDCITMRTQVRTPKLRDRSSKDLLFKAYLSVTPLMQICKCLDSQVQGKVPDDFVFSDMTILKFLRRHLTKRHLLICTGIIGVSEY